MSIPDWLATTLQHTAQTPAPSPKSGNSREWEQKVGTAESLTQQGFQGFVPTVPTVPTKKQSPGKTTETGGNAPAVAANDADTGHPIPDDLPGLVSRVATLEGWPQDLQAEHLAIIRLQLVTGECDADTIRAGWLAHIDRWHNVREAIEERAAIMEYDGGVPRKQADQLAARGQGGLFDAPSAAPSIEQAAPNTSSGKPDDSPANDGPKPVANDSLTTEPASGLFGPIYHGLTNQPEEAIRKLLQEQQGEVPDAYIHPELGNIALLYGDEKMGLRHIIARRGMEWVERIPGILRNGELVRDGKHPRAYLVDRREDPAHVSVVRLKWDGHEKTWLMTAYEDDQGKFARQSRLSNEPTASAASRIPAANGQSNDSTVKSDGEVFEFPNQQIADSYRHISHRGSDSAKAEENAFNQSIERIRSEVGAMVQTEAQQAAFDSAMAGYQRGYIDASLKVARAREGTMSPLVAGRNNFNGKQAARTGGAYEKAQDEFARKVGRLKAVVEEAVRDARTPEQIQAEQDKAAEKARKKRIKALNSTTVNVYVLTSAALEGDE